MSDQKDGHVLPIPEGETMLDWLSWWKTQCKQSDTRSHELVKQQRLQAKPQKKKRTGAAS
jgi:hypothetical protein